MAPIVSVSKPVAAAISAAHTNRTPGLPLAPTRYTSFLGTDSSTTACITVATLPDVGPSLLLPSTGVCCTIVVVVDVSAVPGRNGTDVPGRDGTDVPGRDGIDVPGTDGIDVPGRDGTSVVPGNIGGDNSGFVVVAGAGAACTIFRNMIPSLYLRCISLQNANAPVVVSAQNCWRFFRSVPPYLSFCEADVG